MKRPLIKTCGITNFEDAHLCLLSGADMLGFIFYEHSPRFIQLEQAGDIINKLKTDFDFKAIGVFVNHENEFVIEAIKKTNIDILQFHGDESWQFIKSFNMPKIKVFRIKDKSDIIRCDEYKDTDFFLFDTFSIKAYGGSGISFDWNFLENFTYKDRLFLAGGINGDNVIQAIKSVSPYAIDVSSGLEKEPGKKDRLKVEKFFLKLKAV